MKQMKQTLPRFAYTGAAFPSFCGYDCGVNIGCRPHVLQTVLFTKIYSIGYLNFFSYNSIRSRNNKILALHSANKEKLLTLYRIIIYNMHVLYGYAKKIINLIIIIMLIAKKMTKFH
jgi:hypothetical protein